MRWKCSTLRRLVKSMNHKYIWTYVLFLVVLEVFTLSIFYFFTPVGYYEVKATFIILSPFVFVIVPAGYYIFKYQKIIEKKEEKTL